MLQFHCPSCDSKHAVDEQAAIIVCPVCSRVFPMTDEHIIGYQDDGKRSKSKNTLKKMPPSKNLEIEQTDDELRITWWRCASINGLQTGIITFGNGIAWLIAITAFAGANGEQGVMLFSVILIALCVGLTYTMLAARINGTTVRIIANKIILEHSPLPVLKSRQEFSADTIAELYIRRSRDPWVRLAFLYHICLLTHDNDMPKRLICTKNVNEALALEQQITAYLDNETRIYSLDAI